MAWCSFRHLLGGIRHARCQPVRSLGTTSISGKKLSERKDLSGTSDSQRDSHESIRANSFAIETPIFIARQADSHESLEFRVIRANRANRFARITPLRKRPILGALGGSGVSLGPAKTYILRGPRRTTQLKIKGLRLTINN